MIYADFEYYATVYQGSAISDDQYCGLARKASAYIDYITMNRAKNVSGNTLTAVQNCMCALAEFLQDNEKLEQLTYSTDRPVNSETVGGWSRSYGARNLSQIDLQASESRRREILLMYLGPTGLLKARGYGPCPCSPTL